MGMLAKMALHVRKGGATLADTLELQLLAVRRRQHKILTRANLYDFAVFVLNVVTVRQHRPGHSHYSHTCKSDTAHKGKHEEKSGYPRKRHAVPFSSSKLSKYILHLRVLYISVYQSLLDIPGN
jgi:hypothetical protein